MLFEDQRLLHEDLERLEQAIADRMTDDNKLARSAHLQRDHEVKSFLDRMQDQSRRLLELYRDPEGQKQQEIQSISTGDVFDEFYKQLNTAKDFHKRYPNEPVENLERAYKRRAVGDGEPLAFDVDAMFTGEEGYGRFFDLNMLHEAYLNLPGISGVGRRRTYLQYLDTFDAFTPPEMPMKREDKRTDTYFGYLGNLASYLETFMERTRPLQDHQKLLSDFDKEFEESWAKDEIPGWEPEEETAPADSSKTKGSGEGIWCEDCEKEFANSNVYNHHLSAKKHKKNAEARQARQNGATSNGTGQTNGATSTARLKDKAIAQREFRIRKLAAAMSTERSDTRHNVERRQGMTEKERQQELQAMYTERAYEPTNGNGAEGEGDSEEDEDAAAIYNPLKLPLAWDGRPIPFWLYKLHGLGVEFPCEICGNFVYMGRRAFDKHFSEQRHVYGLKCLGIMSTNLFREITKIEEAVRLWNKMQADKKKERTMNENVVEMEDSEGHVMPEKVYRDLERQGLL